jgi:hypothetical protein
MIGE